jgi:uncharacterized protein YuzE
MVLLRYDREGEVARLWLDDRAVVRERFVFTDAEHREAWGITLGFDADRHLVLLEFGWPERQVPPRLLSDGAGTRATYDPEVGAAYLYLQEIEEDGVAETLSLGEWGVNIDFDAGGRLVGIEFEDAHVAPAAVLAGAELLE